MCLWVRQHGWTESNGQYMNALLNPVCLEQISNLPTGLHTSLGNLRILQGKDTIEEADDSAIGKGNIRLCGVNWPVKLSINSG